MTLDLVQNRGHYETSRCQDKTSDFQHQLGHALASHAVSRIFHDLGSLETAIPYFIDAIAQFPDDEFASALGAFQEIFDARLGKTPVINQGDVLSGELDVKQVLVRAIAAHPECSPERRTLAIDVISGLRKFQNRPAREKQVQQPAQPRDDGPLTDDQILARDMASQFARQMQARRQQDQPGIEKQDHSRRR